MPQLLKHQQDFVVKDIKKSLLVWGTGTGKSLASIAWAFYKKEGEPILVICPKYLIKKWEKEFFKSLDNNPMLTELMKIEFANDRIKIISKETFRRDWDKLKGFQTVIIDEAHYFSGVKSQMSKNLLKYIKKHNTQNILGLTATPFLSSPMNIYTLGKILGKSGYEWSYPYFQQKYFNFVPMGMRMIPVMKKGIKDVIAKKVGEIASVVNMQDCVDIPEENNVVEYFEMTNKQKAAIKNLQEPMHITRWTKTHQICGGYLKGDDYNPDQEVESDKLKRVLEIAAENQKSIIVSRYRGEIDMIAQEIVNSQDPELMKKKVFIINGDIEDKQAVLDEANKSTDCVLLVSAACSEGWEASTFDTMVFYSYDFSLKNYIQMKGRIQRINAIQKCNYISLVVEDSIDAEVYESVAIKKNDFHLSIYDRQVGGDAVVSSMVSLAQELSKDTGKDTEEVLESIVTKNEI